MGVDFTKKAVTRLTEKEFRRQLRNLQAQLDDHQEQFGRLVTVNQELTLRLDRAEAQIAYLTSQREAQSIVVEELRVNYVTLLGKVKVGRW